MTFIQNTTKIAEATAEKKQTFIQKICNKLGENNKPIFTVMAIATGKGIVRPSLTITDKKERPDARKYATLRELMTEFIGVPTTFVAGWVAESLTGLLAKKGTLQYKNTKSVLSLLGICSAAGYFVPHFCNKFMPPIMKKLMPNYDPNASTSQPVHVADLVPQKQEFGSFAGALKSVGTPKINMAQLNTYPKSSLYLNSGMKV
ncbi:MAG: hypothetical protein SPL73_00400 [Cyanobacteriota bacterium]|nr:hypothetical protein [Cyanobacteriota bacterium]MDY6363332.1 hypothetical protein [Cyanobacteriota bacterium]